MKKCSSFFACLLFHFVSVSLMCEGQSISNVLNRYVEDLKISASVPVPSSLLLETEALKVIQASSVYYSNSSDIIRTKVYLLVGRVGTSSKQNDVRRLAVDQLVQISLDKKDSDMNILWSILSLFRSTDFSVSAKDSLRSAVKYSIVHSDKLLRLVGYLQMVELKEEIRPLTLSSNKKDRWAALLSLSRMGDEESIQSVLSKVQRLRANDELVYNIFPDLVYTRQHVLIDYMITVLNGTEKNCLSEDEVPVLCGYRVMEQLAQIIEDYPVQIDASGDIRTKDYVMALNDVKSWFRLRAGNYKINRDKF